MSEFIVFIQQMIDYIAQDPNRFLVEFLRHILISGFATTVGIIIAVPVGIFLTRHQKLAGPVFNIVNILQTIPVLALLGLMIPFFGIGLKAALFTFCVYAVLPILRNTYAGILEVDSGVVEAARGMGMTNWQRLLWVELPAASSIIMAGIRTAAVIMVSWTTVAAFIGGGGLGTFIVGGLSFYRWSSVMVGAIPVALLALFVDFLLGKVEIWVTPRGLKSGS